MSTIYDHSSKRGVTSLSERGGLYAPHMMVEEAATFLGKSQNTIINMCKDGRLEAVPVTYGSKTSYRIPASSVLTMQEILKNKAARKTYTQAPKATHSHKDLIRTYIRGCFKS